MGKYTIDFGRYHFLCNAAAFFALDERFDADGGYIHVMTEKAEKGRKFEALVAGLAVMSQQGELMRRMEGHEKGEMLAEEWLVVHLMPGQLREAQEIVMATVARGVHCEDENEVRDLVQEEIDRENGGKKD